MLLAKLRHTTNAVARDKLLFAKPRKQRMLQPLPNCYSRFAKPRQAINVAARGELRFATFIIGASLSEPLLDELAGALFWYIYIYIYIIIYIYLYPQSILVPREPPVNAQRANVKPAE